MSPFSSLIFLLGSAPKILAAPATSSFFHLLICVGWTSNRIANSAMVSSPFSASMATRALKSGLCFLRFCFNFLLLFILFILRAGFYLNNLSSFWGPPHKISSLLNPSPSWAPRQKRYYWEQIEQERRKHNYGYPAHQMKQRACLWRKYR